MDIDYMALYKDFTTDPINFPIDQVAAFVDELHINGQHFVPIVDPGIMVDSNYSPYTTGVELDLYIKDLSGKLYKLMYICMHTVYACMYDDDICIFV